MISSRNFLGPILSTRNIKNAPLINSPMPQTQSWLWKKPMYKAEGRPKKKQARPTIVTDFFLLSPESIKIRDISSSWAISEVKAAKHNAKKNRAKKRVPEGIFANKVGIHLNVSRRNYNDRGH